MNASEAVRTATQLAQENKIDDAIAVLGRCLKQAALNSDNHGLALVAKNAALLCDRVGHLDECAEHYLTALRLEPGNVYVLWALGDVYARAGREALCARYWTEFEQAAAQVDEPEVRELLERHKGRRQL